MGRMTDVPEWNRKENALERTFEFSDFAKAMVFVNKIAALAESEAHHPDISISYNKVTLRLSTHDAAGVTEKDESMARKVNEFHA